MDGGSLLTRGGVSFGPFRLFAVERQLKKGEEPLEVGGRAFDTLIAFRPVRKDRLAHLQKTTTLNLLANEDRTNIGRIGRNPAAF